jgi:hypothetical protein
MLTFWREDMGLESSRRDFQVIHLVDLHVSPTSNFGLEKPTPNASEKRESTKDEGDLSSQVCLVGVEKIWKDKSPHGLELAVSQYGFVILFQT